MAGNKPTSRQIGKLIGASILLFLGISRNIKDVGEVPGDQYFQNYLEQTESSWSSEALLHSAAPSLNFSLLCQTKPLCKVMTFIGNYPETEKVINTQTLTTITDFLDTGNIITPRFSPTIKLLKFTNGEWERRGYATRDSIVFNTELVTDQQEFHQLSTHELGHIFDLGFLQGNTEIKDTTYTEFGKSVFAKNDPSLYFYKLSRLDETTRKSTMKKKNFCSGYGMTNPFEDFAECFNLYLNHATLFKFLAKKDDILGAKYNFLATLFKGSAITQDTKSLLLVKDNTNRRPRDTTKIQ